MNKKQINIKRYYLSSLMMEICTSLLSPIVSSMKASISLLKRML